MPGRYAPLIPAQDCLRMRERALEGIVETSIHQTKVSWAGLLPGRTIWVNGWSLEAMMAELEKRQAQEEKYLGVWVTVAAILFLLQIITQL